jgi:hypothetical protein
MEFFMKNFLNHLQFLALILLLTLTQCGGDNNNSNAFDFEEDPISFDFSDLEERVANISNSQNLNNTISQRGLTLDEVTEDLGEIIQMVRGIQQVLLNDAYQSEGEVESRSSINFNKAVNVASGNGICSSRISYDGNQNLNDSNISSINVLYDTICENGFQADNFDYSIAGEISQETDFESDLSNSFFGSQYSQDYKDILEFDLQVFNQNEYVANLSVNRVEVRTGNLDSPTTEIIITAIILSGERFDCRARIASVGQNIPLNCVKYIPN